MTTIIGKVLVFVIVIISLAALGFSVWAFLDRRDYKAEEAAMKAEIGRRLQAKAQEEAALQGLLATIASGSHRIRWTYTPGGDPTRPNPGKPEDYISIAQANKAVEKLQADNLALFNKASDLQIQVATLIDNIAQQRKASEQALAEQKNLREQIKPDPDRNPQARAYRDIIADYRTAASAAEQEQERIIPDLIHETTKLSLLLKRNQQLERRLEELKLTKASAAALP